MSSTLTRKTRVCPPHGERHERVAKEVRRNGVRATDAESDVAILEGCGRKGRDDLHEGARKPFKIVDEGLKLKDDGERMRVQMKKRPVHKEV